MMNDREKQQAGEDIFTGLAGLFIASLITMNVVAEEYFSIFGWSLPCSVLVYPVLALTKSVITKIYDPKWVILLIVMGCITCLIITTLVSLADALPSARGPSIGDASFSAVFGPFSEILLRLVVSYGVFQWV
jgi:uncharacterized PurR-regulated membrane protein YhhQ (DUF165 family)